MVLGKKKLLSEIVQSELLLYIPTAVTSPPSPSSIKKLDISLYRMVLLLLTFGLADPEEYMAWRTREVLDKPETVQYSMMLDELLPEEDVEKLIKPVAPPVLPPLMDV